MPKKLVFLYSDKKQKFVLTGKQFCKWVPKLVIPIKLHIKSNFQKLIVGSNNRVGD